MIQSGVWECVFVLFGPQFIRLHGGKKIFIKKKQQTLCVQTQIQYQT
jgi:hypothetical protein